MRRSCCAFARMSCALGDVERRYSDTMLALPALGEWLAAAEAEGMALPKYDKIA